MNYLRHYGVVWFTGISGAGKTTIAERLKQELMLRHDVRRCRILDGDELRAGLNKDLGFSMVDRRENVRRTAEVASILASSKVFTIVSTISPTNEIRYLARKIVEAHDLPFVLVHVDTPFEVAEERDVKGLYKKARAGEVMKFTGFTSEFEQPEKADVTVRGFDQSDEASMLPIIAHLKDRDILYSFP